MQDLTEFTSSIHFSVTVNSILEMVQYLFNRILEFLFLSTQNRLYLFETCEVMFVKVHQLPTHIFLQGNNMQERFL